MAKHYEINGQRLHFGAKPAVRTERTARSAVVMHDALSSLGLPPAASDDYTAAVKAQNNGQWEILGNDSVGDCVEADDGHYLMLRTANVGKIIVPTTQDIIDLYSAETGYVAGDEATDNGTSETSACEYMQSTGLLGHKSEANGALIPYNLNHVKWAQQLFGRARLGIIVPAYLMEQFSAGEIWHYDSTRDQTPEGGHDVPFVRYNADDTGVVITWGKEQLVDLKSFFAQSSGLVTEVHAEVYPDWIRAVGTAPSGLDLSALVNELAALEN